MIKPLQNSAINFKGTTQSTNSAASPLLQERLNASSNADYIKFQAQATQKTQDTQNETSGEKKTKVPFFTRALNFVKGTNKNINTIQGAIKGVVCAIPATLVSGALFKNIKQNSKDGALSVKGAFDALGGTIADGAIGIVNAGKFLWGLKDKKVTEAIGSVLTSPSKFYTKYMKENKGLAAAASAIGIGVIAYNVIKSRLSANRQNSNIDHTFYTEHKA